MPDLMTIDDDTAKESAAGQGEAPEDRLAGTATVLLVDDDPRNLFALESLLEGADYAVVKAQSGDEALLALMNHDIAAIVLDVQMPEVNGIELARLIKQRKTTRHIPIIFLTAHYREEQHAMLAYDAGAVDYLTKPVHPAVLRSKVGVFVDLFRKTRALAALNARLEEQNFALQREAEERLRRIEAETARAEAEAANAAKDRFLAMLSHELRTPLTPIVYATALLEMDENCPPHVSEAAATIRRNVKLEARLIDDLLDIARIRSEKITLQKQVLDVHEVLRDAVTICLSDAGRDHAAFVEQFGAARPQVEADPARLRQIFWNLLNNALKFTPRDGTIRIRTSNFDGRLVVAIEDTGAGIDPPKLERIFDAFEQAEQHSASAGLGLGLAICKALVSLHGGTIEARSEGPGRGSSFIVVLPSLASASISRPPAAAPPSVVNAMRVLLVDDHQDTVESLRILLTRQGHEVRTAASIEQAMTVAEDYGFDILISDIGLPDGRGTELLTRLQVRDERPIPAIAMSGFGMQEDRDNSCRAGFAEHLTKPVEFSVLQQAITKLVPRVARPDF